MENKIEKLINDIENLNDQELEELIKTLKNETKKIELNNMKKAALIEELKKL